MAIGDQDDLLRRLKAVTPVGWFPDQTPVLDGVLSGIAAIWSWAWSLLDYVAKQRRIGTATDVNLDLIAMDFLGAGLPRLSGEGDDSYRRRLKASIFREMGTRKAVSDAIETVTGQAPGIFEPSLASDTGGYGSAGKPIWTGLAYGKSGGYGSYDLPFQAFVTAYRPILSSGSGVQGYGSARTSAYAPAIGGYGAGALEFMVGQSGGAISIGDEQIIEAANDVRPIATVLWVAVTDKSSDQTGPIQTAAPLLDVNFVLNVSELS
jgi:hypothetical protein